MHAEMIIHQLGMAQFVVDRNTAGITHEESLVRPAAGGNSLNWVMGHLVYTYDQALTLLGGAALFPGAETEAYGFGRPGPDDADSVRFEVLLDRFRDGGQAVSDAVRRLNADDLACPSGFSPTGDASETVGSVMSSIAFHQAYHTGQTGTLRRLLGHPGAIRGPGE